MNANREQNFEEAGNDGNIGGTKPYSTLPFKGRVKAGKRAKLFRLQGLLVDRRLTLGRSFEGKDRTNRLS